MRKFLIFISLLVLSANLVFAISPIPKLTLNTDSITTTDIDGVYAEGFVSIFAGQKIVVKKNGLIIAGDTAKSDKFKIKIPKAYLKTGKNVFSVKSTRLKGKVNSSTSKTLTVNISPKKAQTITASDISIMANQSKALNAKISSGLTLSYKSSNPNIASVDAKGVVTGKTSGKVTIVISQAGNKEYNATTKRITATVKKASQSITASDKSVVVGGSVNLGISLSSGLKPEYKSSDVKIATVDGNGKVTGVKAGKATISIIQPGDSTYASVTKNITITVTKADQTISASGKTVKVGQSVAIGAKAKTKLTYKSSNTSIATVSADGKVTGKKAGSAKITINAASTDQYNAASKVITITVQQNTYTIQFMPNGGTGASYKQTASADSYTKLYANRFKRAGYQFMGWATEATKPVMSGTDVTKFKNVNMKNFQLGQVAVTRKPSAKGIVWSKLKDSQKQHMLDKVNVVSLAAPGKTVKLYAVWKGKGPEAAVDWAKLIAKDNNFMYGVGERAHRHGCYFCGTNRTKKNATPGSAWDKTYCCNPFIKAAYEHGANHGYVMGNMEASSWTNYSNSHGTFKRIYPSKSELKSGDILTSEGHVWMYIGGGKIIHAGSEGWTAGSISEDTSLMWGSCKNVIRYYPK